MEKRDLIIIVVVLLTLGLLFHGFKNLRKARLDGAKNGINASDIDDTPYHVSSDVMDSDRVRQQGRGRGMHLAGAVSIFNQYDFSGGKAIAKAKEEVKKKKKKTDKKEDEKTAVAADDRPYYQTNQNNNTATNTNNQNQNVVAVGQDQPKAVGSGQNGGGGNDNSNNTYQEWAQLILGTPNPGNVAKFVAAYKAHEVSSQVFYKILDAMILEQNSQQQQLAVSAAGDVPSAQSFEFLVQVTKQNSAAAQQANTLINGYSALGEVDALQVVMSSYLSDSTTIQDATNVLLNSAETNISSRQPTATGGATGTTSNLASVYAGFVPLLNRIISTYASNANIENAAQSALSLISPVVTR